MYYETKQVLDLETGVLLQTEKKKKESLCNSVCEV